MRKGESSSSYVYLDGSPFPATFNENDFITMEEHGGD
jgi:hypothetical protein